MEYVFGTKGSAEVLKTKGSAHTDLTGWQEVKREYAGVTITDRFRVVRKIASNEDASGNCYDWYEIDRHYRMQDSTARNAANIDYLSMMVGVDLPDGREENNVEV